MCVFPFSAFCYSDTFKGFCDNTLAIFAPCYQCNSVKGAKKVRLPTFASIADLVHAVKIIKPLITQTECCHQPKYSRNI